MSSQAGSVIRVGSRVSALIGELGYWNGPAELDVSGKQKKRVRERFVGTVAESKPDRKWLVRWDRTGLVGQEEYSTFKLRYEGAGSDLRPTNQEVAQIQSQAEATARHQQAQGVVATAANVQQETAGPTQQAATAGPPQQGATTTEATTATTATMATTGQQAHQLSLIHI